MSAFSRDDAGDSWKALAEERNRQDEIDGEMQSAASTQRKAAQKGSLTRSHLVQAIGVRHCHHAIRTDRRGCGKMEQHPSVTSFITAASPRSRGGAFATCSHCVNMHAPRQLTNEYPCDAIPTPGLLSVSVLRSGQVTRAGEEREQEKRTHHWKGICTPPREAIRACHGAALLTRSTAPLGSDWATMGTR